MGVNPGGLGATSRFWGREDVGEIVGFHEIYLYPIMYIVQKYEIETIYKVVTFQK